MKGLNKAFIIIITIIIIIIIIIIITEYESDLQSIYAEVKTSTGAVLYQLS